MSEIKFFLNKNKQFTDTSFHVLHYYPKFQQKYLLLEKKTRVIKLLPGKYHMPLNYNNNFLKV